MLILKLYPKDFLKPLLCGFLLVFLFIGSVQGNEPQVKLTPEERAWLAEHPDITFGFADQYEPFLIKGADGRLSGILVDFLNQMNSRLGTQFKPTGGPWAEILEQVDRRELAGTLTMTPQAADTRGLLKTETQFNIYPAIFARSDASFTINGLDDLRGKTVAIIDPSHFSEKILGPLGDEVDIKRIADDVELMRRVYEGKVDAALTITSHNYIVAEYGFAEVRPVHIFLDQPIPSLMGVRPDWPELVSILNKGIASFSQDEINALMVKWINVPVESPASLKLTKVEKDWLAQHPVVTVGVWENPPAQFRVDGVAKGYRVELMEAMLRDAGLQPRYRFLPLKDILKGLREGSVDIAMAFLKTPERSEYLNYSLHEFQANFAIFAQTQRTDISDMASLRGKTVGSYKGYGLENALKAWSPDSPVVQADDVKGMLRLVATGEADFCVQEISSGGFHLQQEHLANVEPKGYFQTPGGEAKHSFDYVVRKSPPILTSILHKAEQSLDSEEKQRIWNHWYPSSALSKQLPEVDFSKEERDWLDTHPKISFAFPLTYPPALMSDKEGRLSGQLKDILDLLNRKMGTDFGIVAVAGGTALNELHKSRKVAGQLAVVKGNGAARGLLETNSLYTPYSCIKK